MASRGDTSGLAERASLLGFVDAFVFRRVARTQWVHLGGLGRGRGWAGLVDVDEMSDPTLTRVPSIAGAVTRFDHSVSTRVLGPYYGVSGAIVRVTADVFVLLGHPSKSQVVEVAEQDLRDLARSLDEDLEDIKPSKRLGDELEVLHAVRAATTGPAAGLVATMRHLLEVAMESLSCELGLFRDGRGHLVTIGLPADIDPDDPAVSHTLDRLQLRAQPGQHCIQDVGTEALGPPLGPEHDVCAVLSLAIPEPVGGILVVAHTTATPRGFTSLCKQLGGQVADAAGVVAHTASLREELQAVANEQSRTARRDPLTGLGNRLSWDEALADIQDDIARGSSATVVTVDVDGLKYLNDTLGHDAGDRLLCRCATILREHARDSDVCVRLGGDEFAVLLPFTGPLAQARVESLREALGASASCNDVVAASVGAAVVEPGGRIADAVREADAAMYSAKRARRGQALLATP